MTHASLFGAAGPAQGGPAPADRQRPLPRRPRPRRAGRRVRAQPARPRPDPRHRRDRRARRRGPGRDLHLRGPGRPGGRAAAAADPAPGAAPTPRPATRWPTSVVNHVGEAVVMVVATDRYVAEDACERIRVDYELLPAVVGSETARAGRRLVHEDVPGNVAAHMVQEVGDAGAADRRRPAHAGALARDRAQRVACRWRARASTPAGTPTSESLRVYSSTQTSTGVRAAVAAKLGLPLDKVECIAPDVGGGFGVKIMHPWPEEVLVPWAARRLEPRGQVGRGPARALHLLRPRARPAAAGRGRLRRRGPDARPGRAVLARQRRLHAVRHHRADHHLDPAARAVQARRLPGASSRSLYTNTVIVTPYRGAGRPQGVLRDGAHDGRDRRPPRPGPGRRCASATSSSRRRCPTTTG